jgi:hypothetical protein
MAYKIQAKIKEDGKWYNVIDTAKSRITKVDMVFMNEAEAQHYIDNKLKITNENLVRIVDFDSE